MQAVRYHSLGFRLGLSPADFVRVIHTPAGRQPVRVWGLLLTSARSDTSKGVFLVKMKKAFEPVKRDYSVNIYSRFSTVP